MTDGAAGVSPTAKHVESKRVETRHGIVGLMRVYGSIYLHKDTHTS